MFDEPCQWVICSFSTSTEDTLSGGSCLNCVQIRSLIFLAFLLGYFHCWNLPKQVWGLPSLGSPSPSERPYSLFVVAGGAAKGWWVCQSASVGKLEKRAEFQFHPRNISRLCIEGGPTLRCWSIIPTSLIGRGLLVYCYPEKHGRASCILPFFHFSR